MNIITGKLGLIDVLYIILYSYACETTTKVNSKQIKTAREGLIAIPPKLIYEFNAIPNISPTVFEGWSSKWFHNKYKE